MLLRFSLNWRAGQNLRPVSYEAKPFPLLAGVGVIEDDMNVSGQVVAAVQEARIVPLSQLRAGEKGQIGEILGNGEMVHRLREIGLYHGALVQMVRPGSPCIIRLHGQRLGFRVDDIAHVMVHVAIASRRPA